MRILLADDQPKVRLGLRLLLEQDQGLTVVAEATDAEGLLAHAETAQPDLVLLDWSLQASPGLDLVPALRRLRPDLAVIVLSGLPEAEQDSLEAGADAFVSKADPPEQLLAAIAGVQRDENTAVASTATPTDEKPTRNQISKAGGTR
jgi:DNA-binding NarL/FixJ family response regulator